MNNILAAIEFNVQRFLESFQYMAKGMLGIFIVIGIIILGIVVLNKLTGSKKKEEDKKD